MLHESTKRSCPSLNSKIAFSEYCQVGNKRLPIRWMAPETLFEGQCTSKSDVWSFAVVCWEIFTLGQLPHENYTNQQLIQGKISLGYTAFVMLEK